MAIVINDFEITVEPPKKGVEGTPSAGGEEAPSPLRPEDIARIERYFRERRLRVFAN